MSEAAIALTAALVGAIVSLLGTFLSRSHDRFLSQTGGLEVVRGEIESAHRKVRTTIRGGNIWPAGYPLRSHAWESHRAELAPGFKQGTLRELQACMQLLETGDGIADAVRNLDDAETKKKEKEKFREWLPELEGKLSEALTILDNALSCSHSQHKRRLGFATVFTLVLVAVAVLLVLPGGSSITSTSLARELRQDIPGAGRSVCEPRANLDGAYRCAVEVSTCHGQLEASTGAPACARSKTVHLGVDTSDACYFYEVADDIGSGRSPPQQSRGLIRRLTDWICKKP